MSIPDLSKKLTRFLLIPVMAVAVVAPASALASNTLSQTTYLVEKDKVVEGNVYLDADEVVVEGTIQGDLVVVARTIVIKGVVEGSVMGAASESITVEGTITNSLRAVSQTITVAPTGHIQEDITALADRIELKPDSIVGDSLYFIGNEAALNGGIGKESKTLLSSNIPAPTLAERLYNALMSFLSLGLLGVVLLSFLSAHHVAAKGKSLLKDVWLNLLIGVIGVVLAPFIIILLLLSSVGRELALFSLCAFLIVILLSMVDVSYLIGSKILSYRSAEPRYTILTLLIGAFLLTLCLHLPYIALIGVVVLIAAVGNRLRHLKEDVGTLGAS